MLSVYPSEIVLNPIRSSHPPGSFPSPLARTARLLALACCLLLTGCSQSLAQAPAFYMFSSYFPSWLIGAGIGIVLIVPVRWLLIRIGIDDALPMRVLFYSCLVIIFTIGFSYVFSAQ